MSIPLAVPVMMICLTVTTPENDAGSHSTVAKLEIVACTPCADAKTSCPLPPAFEKLAREISGKAPQDTPGKRKPARKK